MKSKKRKNPLNRLHNFIYWNFKLSLKQLNEIRYYVWFSLILFFCTGIFGYFFPVFFEEKILNLLKEIISQTEGLSTLELIEFIFMNNLQSSFFAMLFGVVLGFVPFLVIVINGYILGFVASKTVALEGAGILWELLPHGIFELPAVFISTGLGLRLGLFLIICRKKTWDEFRNLLINVFRVFIFIVVPLLIVAAIIEGWLIIFLG